MKILVTGGREYDDWSTFSKSMWDLLDSYGLVNQATIDTLAEPITIIHGDAKGADFMARIFCKLWGITEVRCPADWKKHKYAAGPIRNSEMLELNPWVVIAFKGGNGTADMVKKATKAGVRVVEITGTRDVL